MPDIDQRDPAEVATILARWLSTKVGAGAEVSITEVQAPASNGFSNETILCRTHVTRDGVTEDKRLVVRVAPTKHLLFMNAAFDTQYKVMKAVADSRSGVPLPTLGYFEEDTSYLGVPFFTMEHVEGLVPADNLPYTMEGWVIEATPEQQATMWWSGIDALAAVHRTDWRAAGLDWLDDPSRGKPGIEQQLSYYRDFLDWAVKGVHVPVIESTWEWLVANRPEELGDVVLSWGDSRIGNVIWDDFRCAAVLDWEMASLGQPEMDLGWWLYFDRQFSEGLQVPRPAGFGSHEDTIARYAELMGRPMQNIFYYEVFSGFRFAVVMLRLSDLLMGSDILPNDSDMGTNNLATQLLAKMLELPVPT